MKYMRRKLQIILSSMFAFSLTIAILILVICTGLGLGLFNRSNIRKSIDQSNYFSEVHKELNQKTEDILGKAGFPQTILKEVISLERVYVAGMNVMEASLDKTGSKIQTDKLVVDMKQKLEGYLLAEGIQPSEKLDLSTHAVIMAVESEYKNGVHLRFVDYLMEFQSDYVHVLIILLPCLILCIGILCFFLLRMNHCRYRGMRYIVYALIASSLLTIMIAICLLVKRPYEKIEIGPEYYNYFLASYFRRAVIVFAYIGGFGILLSVVLLSFISDMKNRSTKVDSGVKS